MKKASGYPRQLVKDGAETGELFIEGKTRLRKRRASHQRITAEQIRTFFAMLADTCNIEQSAKAAKFTAAWAHKKRRTDAGFRAAWVQAVAEAYAKLEMVLLERSISGRLRYVRVAGGSTKRIREYNDQTALALLKHHAATAAAFDNPMAEADANEMRDRILAKLARRMAREAGKQEASKHGPGHSGASDAQG